MILNKKNNHQQGFTLIETFVATLILVFAVIGPLGLLARAISDGNYAKNQVTAYYLAQEAVEKIINQRDSNLEAGQPWLVGVPLENCGGNACRLYIKEEGGLESYSTETTSDPSIFSRRVTIGSADDRTAKVEVQMVWINKDRPVEFILETTLHNKSYEDDAAS